jgi:hypothetical protein
MDEAGRLLANLASVVPQGLVAFAPSFAFCEQLLERWRATGLLQQLSARKRFFKCAGCLALPGAAWHQLCTAQGSLRCQPALGPRRCEPGGRC